MVVRWNTAPFILADTWEEKKDEEDDEGDEGDDEEEEEDKGDEEEEEAIIPDSIFIAFWSQHLLFCQISVDPVHLTRRLIVHLIKG